MKTSPVFKFAAAAALLVLMIFSSALAAESDFIFDAEYGAICGYVGSDTDVVIPETIGGVKVEYVNSTKGSYWDIVSLHIPAGVKELELGMCPDLEKVSFAAGSQLESLGTFNMSKKLREITLPDSLTRLENYVFSDCQNLTSINIPAGVTKIPYGAFTGCIALESVVMHDNIKEIDHWAFNGCAALKEIYLPKDLSFLSSDAFPGCDNLTVYVFKGTDAHDWVVQDGLNYEFITAYPTPSPAPTPTPAPTPSVTLGPSEIKVELIDDKYIRITKYTGSGSKVVIPETVAGMDVIAIGDEAFARKANITEVYIPSSVQSIGNSAFRDCSALKRVDLPDGLESIGYYAFAGCGALTEISIPEGVNSIGQYAFADCFALKEFAFPSSMNQILFAMFSGCTSLERVTIPDSITKIGEGSFMNCSSLTEIHIPEKATYIGEYAFSGCKRLSKINIPSGVTIIPQRSFYDCDSLKSITLPEGMTMICELSFYGCELLEEINLPESLSLISSDAFQSCPKLTAKVVKGSYAHEWCIEYGLDYELAASVTSKPDFEYEAIDETNVKITAYNGDASEVKIPETIDGCAVQVIGSGAFASSPDLRAVVIPACVRSIEAGAFGGGLESIVCEGGAFPVMASGAFVESSIVILGEKRPAFTGTKCDIAAAAFPGWNTAGMVWSSSDGAVVEVTGGVINPVKGGEAIISAQWDGLELRIPLIVHATQGSTLVLPDDLEIIRDEAFKGVTVRKIVVPDGCKTIGSRAFADSETLLAVELPKGVAFADDILEGSPNAVIVYRAD